MADYGLIINGEKVSTDKTFSVINPATEEVLAECPIATKAQLDAAVNAAVPLDAKATCLIDKYFA